MKVDRAESFLKLIRKSNRGKLKIYLGYAAGVGKTYQMLQEAHRLQRANIDVRIGYIETHNRPETKKLTAGLVQIPLKEVLYHGIKITELDIDAVLLAKPDVVLVDELAHTNLPGSRNKKRYQDIEEILDSGIHVISALNVQHIESLYETVERLINIKVKERVPDRIVLEADQIVNVDVSSEDLLGRLKEGNIYSKDRIDRALENFFQENHLSRLRELTLREIAYQLDKKQRSPESDINIAANDQIVVCLGSQGPDNEELLRYASRLAGKLNRNWYALYVQTPEESPQLLQPKLQRVLAKTLNLAQELGATVFQWKGNHIGETILQFAIEYRVSHIIIGSPQPKRNLFKNIFTKSILQFLLEHKTYESITIYSHSNFHDKIESSPAADTSMELNFQKELAAKTLLDAKIKIWDRQIEKNEAIEQLLHIANSSTKIPIEDLRLAILEREKLGSTVIGNDISIPHAKIKNLTRAEICIGVQASENNLSLDSFKIMFLILSPAESSIVHLQILSIIAKLGQEDLLIKRMTEADSVESIRETITSFIK
ncbi:PTS sugar transporter subunit IIA [Leptospira sp. 96542]|nr:PTS sugar transporter subunit IIA [Leptospira sp. 96542]